MKTNILRIMLLLCLCVGVAFSPDGRIGLGMNLYSEEEEYEWEDEDWEWGDFDGWDIDDWADFVGQDDFEEDWGIEGSVYDSADDFFSEADIDVISDVFESLDNMGYGDDYITDLKVEYLDALRSNEDYTSISNEPIETISGSPRFDKYGCNCWTADAIKVNKPGNEDVDGNGIKDVTQDMDGNWVNDFVQDMDGNGEPDCIQDTDGDGILDRDDPDPETHSFGSSEDNIPDDDISGTAPDEYGMEEEAVESGGNSLENNGIYPDREESLNLSTDAQKNDYISKIASELIEKMQALMGDEFEPFPPIVYENEQGLARYANGEILINNQFFDKSDALQAAILLHEFTHYSNEKDDVYQVPKSDNGNGRVLGNIAMRFPHISPPEELSADALKHLDERIPMEYESLVNKEAIPFEAFKERRIRNLSPSPKNVYKYSPSDFYRDEQYCYEAMLQGQQDGLYQLSEYEINEIEFMIEQYGLNLINALKFEAETGLQPDGTGLEEMFNKP